MVGGDLGKIKRRQDWAARMQKIVDKMQDLAEQQRQAARNAGGIKVTDELLDQAFKLLDQELEQFIQTVPETEFMFITDPAQVEALKKTRAEIQKNLETATPTDAKALGGSTASRPFSARVAGKKVIIKTESVLSKNKDIRSGWGIPGTADLYAEEAAQIIDELGGLFVNKAQATTRRVPTVPGVSGSPDLQSDNALVMDWLTEGWIRADLSSSKFGARQKVSDAINWDMMQVYEALIGNTDRHRGNWLVAPVYDPANPQQVDKNGDVIVAGQPDSSVPWSKFKIVPIDNGLSFPDASRHRSWVWGNIAEWMIAGEPLNARQLEVLSRLWKNRVDLHRRLSAIMAPGQVRGVFYRLIWMLETRTTMGEQQFQEAMYNPEGSNSDGVVERVLRRGESVLNAKITNPDAIPVAPGQTELGLEP